MNSFFVYVNQLVRGPYTREVLSKMLADGEITATTPVSEGKGRPWRKVSDYPDLAAGAVPENKPNREPEKTAVRESAERPAGDKDEADVHFQCPYCKRKYSGNASWLGRDLVCRSCGKTFVAGARSVPETKSSAGAGNYSAATGTEIPEGSIICPHCWKSFDSEYILYIAAHPQLIGDPLLGTSARKRFAPTSFNALGQAIDPMGVATADMACPHCHLKIPAPVIEENSLYISLVGAPSSGKSYYLASLLHQMKQKIADKFSYSFSDVDPEMNEVPDGYEETLFRPRRLDEVAVLPKTQQTDFVDVVSMHGLPVYLQKPFIYELRSQQRDEGCNLIFYDNAGEHFVPGADNLENPGTRHLACSNGIIFLFDPINDALMRQKCDPRDPQLASDERIYDQTKLMAEMIMRIRKHRNMSAVERCRIPLVIGVGKLDAWRSILSKDLNRLHPVEMAADSFEATWNRNTVMDVSFAVREQLLEYVPELIHTAENFFTDVICMPFSSFGCFSTAVSGGQPGVIPANIAPVWVEEPLLALLANAGLLKFSPVSPEAAQDVMARTTENEILFAHPVSGEKVRLPLNYAGVVLEIGGKKYRLPGVARERQSLKSAVDDLWS